MVEDKILVAVEKESIRKKMAAKLKEAGFAVDHVGDGEDGLHMALNEPYDIAVIDLMLPKIDGLTIIRKMRNHKISTPVLIISAKRSVDERVEGLQTGGDDYLIKPFAFSELLARVQALIRRTTMATSVSELTVGDLTLDIQARKARRAGVGIDLQPLEFSLLEYLMRNAGQVVSKTMIMEHVWDYNFNPQTNVVEARICYLRDKIDKNFDRKLIHTVRGFGYVLKADF